MMSQSSIKDEIKKYTRLQETKSILEFLEKENKKYNKLSKRCSKLDILNDIAVGLGTLGLGLSSTGAITSVVGVSIPISIPTIIGGFSITAISTLISVSHNVSNKKDKKYIKLIEKTNNVLNIYKTNYLKALEDGEISEKEFKELIKHGKDYKDFKLNKTAAVRVA